MSSCSLFAQEVVPDSCSKDQLLSYFPPQFVEETLKRFDISPERREAIKAQLTEKDKEIVQLVQEKAAKLHPNPLGDSQKRQEAVKIFRETLFEIFSSVMEKNGVLDEKKVQSMLDDIQRQKAEQFSRCIERFRNLGTPAQKPETPKISTPTEENPEATPATSPEKAPESIPQQPVSEQPTAPTENKVPSVETPAQLPQLPTQ
jgi:hypothetical protein